MSEQTFKILVDHVEQANGLEIKFDAKAFEILQKNDRKTLSFHMEDVEEVLVRQDSDDKTFLQVNFISGTKILLTNELVGFKPIPIPGLKFDKLPKVVTTSDLVSVFEAAEEAQSAGQIEEVEVLKQVFQSILRGGEKVGFDLSSEKGWFIRLQSHQASA